MTYFIGVTKTGRRVPVYIKHLARKFKRTTASLKTSALAVGTPKALKLTKPKVQTTTIEEDLVLLTPEQLRVKYLVKDANKLAKKYDLKRPKVDGKNVKEYYYWEYLKEQFTKL